MRTLSEPEAAILRYAIAVSVRTNEDVGQPVGERDDTVGAALTPALPPAAHAAHQQRPGVADLQRAPHAGVDREDHRDVAPARGGQRQRDDGQILAQVRVEQVRSGGQPMQQRGGRDRVELPAGGHG